MPCLPPAGRLVLLECVYSYPQPRLCQARGCGHEGPQMPGFLSTALQHGHQAPTFWTLPEGGLAAVLALWVPPASYTAVAGLLLSWLPRTRSQKQNGIPICPLFFSWQASLLPLTSQTLGCERQTFFVKCFSPQWMQISSTGSKANCLFRKSPLKTKN